MIRLMLIALSTLAVAACKTTSPAPVKTLPDGFPLIAVGEWPDDGWKPPPMHTAQEIRAIRARNKHICEYTNKGDCKP